ncbi:hypothetical protein AB205_0129090 [Aquarana catesbeiana]|uniref:Uncharacterized protein n=1 Tax=Aquarana catesbeiana TaxID=8400 RepID=A0A2G9RVZ1_AQUCT|nr:hypothetical protein AB205_0129090 [Aquarana catesbeiana]
MHTMPRGIFFQHFLNNRAMPSVDKFYGFCYFLQFFFLYHAYWRALVKYQGSKQTCDVSLLRQRKKIEDIVYYASVKNEHSE